jgi:hypothetical protein
LYKEEKNKWINLLKEHDIKSILDVRNEKGEIIYKTEFEELNFQHSTLDLIILHLKDEDEFHYNNMFEKTDINLIDNNIQDLYFKELNISTFNSIDDKIMEYKNLTTLTNFIIENKIFCDSNKKLENGYFKHLK